MTSSHALQSVQAGVMVSSFEKGLERLHDHQMVQRLWDKDASLWSGSPSVQERIRHRLGWLSIVSIMQPQLERICATAEAVRKDGYTHAWVLGMGGSSLFPEVCRLTFGVAPGWVDVRVLDSTDPTAIRVAEQLAPLERTCFIVSSKSGATIESNSLADYFYDQVRRAKKDKAGEQFIAITDAGAPLEPQAAQRNYRATFIHGPSSGQDVGGRFSALTCFGLVPAALMGIDIRQLLMRAHAMLASCGPTVPLIENPAAQLAALFGQGACEGRDKMTLALAPAVLSSGTWVEQLIAESVGKVGKGLVPIHEEPRRQPSGYAADRMFVELQLDGSRDAELDSWMVAVAKAGQPVVRVGWRDRYDLGGEVMKWFVATALAGALMDLNPFDEPDVTDSKDRTKALLARFAKEGKLPAEGGTTPDADAVRKFLRATAPGEYVAVLSFLPRTPALDQQVMRLRAAAAEISGAATMLGFGPRYLHSIGQLHKGGPNRARILLLTGEDPVDVPIPGQPYTFSVLKQAQALGDLQALQERGRQVLHLRMGRAAEADLGRVLQALGGSESASWSAAKKTG